MIAAVFGVLWRDLAEPDSAKELAGDDLDDLWARWFQPFVGTGQQDGWLDRTDVPPEKLQQLLADDFTENATALCWLAIRPGPKWRQRVIAWQPALRAAFDKGLIDVNGVVADFLSTVLRRQVPVDLVVQDLLQTLEFIDDRLWCDRTAAALDLAYLDLDTLSPDQRASVRLNVRGIENALYDPRIPQLVVVVRRYRSADAVALYSQDHNWRLVFAAGEPAAYLAGAGCPDA